MIAHGALFPRLVCDPDTGWGPNGDRTATRLMLIGPPHAPPPPPPLAVFAVGVLALFGSFTLGLRLGRTLSNLVIVVLLARRMDSAELTSVDTEWGTGGSTVVGSADAGSSQLEIVMKSRSELPFPGKGGDGTMTVQYLNPDTADKTTLVGWCRSFGLPVSGTKPVLKDRLRAFSASPDKWNSLAGTTRRMHRGPQIGRTTKTASKKQSVRRANEIFSHLQPPLPHLPFALPTVAPPQSAQQQEYILKWAADVSRTYPYLNKKERLQVAQQRLTRNGSTASDVIPQLKHTNARLDQLVDSLASRQPTVDPALGPADADSSGSITSTSYTADRACNPIPASAPAPSPSPCLSSPHRTLTFSNRQVFKFTEEDIPNPPAVSFAENLALLNQMWDDTPPHWQGYSVLIIHGVPIPVVYWKNIYSRRNGEWKGLKSNWSLWKMIITRWRLGTEADFWKEFSDDSGNRLTYTGVVKTLKASRVKLDEEIAARAKEEYGTQFNEIFVYRKNGALHVKTKPSDIAKQYRNLQHMCDEESDS